MKRGIGALVLLVSSVISVGRTAPVAASAAPMNGRILFTHCGRSHGCQIYTANPDGSAVVRVTNEGDSFLGDWSPDGTKIAYASTRSGDLEVWISRADGSHARQLTPNDHKTDSLWPRFTPNGQQVLFTNCKGGDCDGGIGSVNVDGTNFHLITPNSHSSYNLADRSPDGTQMAYMRWHVDGVKMGIYVSDADGTHEQRVSPPRLQGWSPDWSPMGDRIAFATQIFFDRPAPVIYTVQPDGTNRQQITQPTFPHADWAPSYSPDGTTIIFNSDRRYADFCCGDLFTVDAAGGKPHKISLGFDAYDPRWGTAPVQETREAAPRPFRSSGIRALCERVPLACAFGPSPT